MSRSSLRGYNKTRGIDENEIKEKAKDMFNADIKDEDAKGAMEAEDIIKHYEGKSEDELVSELKNLASSGRKDGSFDNDMLTSFYKNVAPMMDNEQKKKLDDLVDDVLTRSPGIGQWYRFLPVQALYTLPVVPGLPFVERGSGHPELMTCLCHTHMSGNVQNCFLEPNAQLFSRFRMHDFPPECTLHFCAFCPGGHDALQA